MLNYLKNHLFIVLGWFCFILGVIGAVLPIMPTVPFLLLAAYCFSKGSPRLYKWILSIPKFGQEIKNWNEYGVVTKKSKMIATCAILLVLTYIHILLTIPFYGKISATVILISVVIYILSRPDHHDKSANKAKLQKENVPTKGK